MIKVRITTISRGLQRKNHHDSIFSNRLRFCWVGAVISAVVSGRLVGPRSWVMRRPPAWLSWLDAERTVEGAPLQARLFLGAALPALAELWPLDEGVRAAAGTGAFSLGFTCLSGGRCALAFDGRRAWWWEGQERARLELVFLAAGQAVATFQERTTLPPLPVRGWQHLGDAARFQRATKRLAELYVRSLNSERRTRFSLGGLAARYRSAGGGDHGSE